MATPMHSSGLKSDGYLQESFAANRALLQLAQEHGGTEAVARCRSRWETILSWTGGLPSSEHYEALFVAHTLLVSLARAIIRGPGDCTDDLRCHPYASWPLQCGAPGAAVMDQITQMAASYSWQCDELSAAHHALVPSGQRKSLGEHYTPRWLAEAVVREVLGR